jgi:hypothetical protein
MEVEQRVIIKFFRFKGMKLVDIYHELIEVFGEEAYALLRVKYWIHQLKTGRTIMTVDVRPGKRSIDHIDALILKQLTETPFASVRSLSQDAEIRKTTVWLRLTESVQFKSRHFKSAPHMVTDELREKRIEGARTLVNVLESQKRIGFRDIITGDESWIYLNMTLNSIWIGAEEIPPLDREQRERQPKQCLLCFGGSVA